MTSRRVVCLDIGGTKLAAGVLDGDARLERRNEVKTRRDEGAERVLSRAVGLVRAVLEAEQEERGPPLAIGISTNGLTREDRVDLAPAVRGWSRLRIPARMREEFPGLSAVTVNDVKAATLAELTWGELRDADTGLYLNFGTGLAAGIVVRGRLVQGAHGAAGEIGYLLPSTEALARLRPGEAPLEEVIGGRGVARWASSELGRTVTMADVVAAGGHDDRTTGVRARLLDEIALWAANIAIIVDPDRVVLGGGLLRSGEPVLARVRDAIGRAVPFPAEVVRARFGADSALVGAGAAALRWAATDLGAAAGRAARTPPGATS